MGGGKHRMRNVPLSERFNSRNLNDGVPRNQRFSFVPRNQTSAPRINPVGNENQDLNTNYHNMNNVPRNRGFNLGRNLDDMYVNGPPQNMIFEPRNIWENDPRNIPIQNLNAGNRVRAQRVRDYTRFDENYSLYATFSSCHPEVTNTDVRNFFRWTFPNCIVHRIKMDRDRPPLHAWIEFYNPGAVNEILGYRVYSKSFRILGGKYIWLKRFNTASM